jgi:hypothetical protein
MPTDTGPEGVTEPVMLTAGASKGTYTGDVAFASAGRWNVHVSFSPDRQRREVIFPVEVARSLPWGVLTGFFVFNAAVIMFAASGRRPRPGTAKGQESS